ncbi:MAG: geranylgeranylglycerol-phosphate geranylgeranyltransferase [Ferruginibacter sp.]|nr:geranylgeranylglycerol-phosphate geranylgeranyltransferase [Cytophagales bacterium]
MSKPDIPTHSPVKATRRRRPRWFLLIGFYRLIRVPNLLIIVLTQYLARIFLIGPRQEWRNYLLDHRFFLLVLSTVIIAAAGYIINDYYDVKIDTINKPKRVVVGRILRRRMAMIAHTGLNVLGLAIGLYLGKVVLVYNFAAAFGLWLYSNQLKRLPLVGNLVIALLTGASLSILAAYFRQHQQLVYTYATFAFFISLIREIIKDMEDVKGDATFGCQTLPIVWGLRRTKLLLYLLTASFLTVIFLMGNHLGLPILGYLFVVVFLPVVWLLVKLVRADTKKDFGYLSNLCKVIMLNGVLSMLWL